VKIGVGSERQKSIPMEVVLKDGSICTDTDIILNTWKTSYENLLNYDDVVNLNDNMSNNILDVDLGCSSKTPEGPYFGYSKVHLDYSTNIAFLSVDSFYQKFYPCLSARY
jgi:hypothetical protein